MSEKKCDIFVCTHKEFDKPNFNINWDMHHIIDCGETDNPEYIHANTGDNLADLGPAYSELRHIYWIWKNYPLNDYVGICHYRRYMRFHIDEKTCPGPYYKDEMEEIEKFVTNNSIIVPYPVMQTGDYASEKVSNYEVYKIVHNIKDFDIFLKIIDEKYPFLSEAAKEMCETNLFYCNYMFIMTKENFNEYCTLMFSILKDIDDALNCHSYDDYYKYTQKTKYYFKKTIFSDDNIIKHITSTEYQVRFPAFIMERFLAIFINYKNLKMHNVARLVEYT